MKETLNELPPILESVLFTKISVNAIGRMPVTKVEAILEFLAWQNNYNLKLKSDRIYTEKLLKSSVKNN